MQDKMTVGTSVIVPDQVFLGKRDMGGVGKVVKIEQFSPKGKNHDIAQPIAFDRKASKKMLVTVEMGDGQRRQYFAKDVKPRA